MTRKSAEHWAEVLEGIAIQQYSGYLVRVEVGAKHVEGVKDFFTAKECFKEALSDACSDLDWGPKF